MQYYLAAEIILTSILYREVKKWYKQMSSQETLQQFAHWPVGKPLCFWLLMCNLWQLKKGHGLLELSPLPTPLIIYDTDFEIERWTKGTGWRMG